MNKLPDVIYRPDLMKPPERKPATLGLGTVIETILHPAAAVVDKLTGSRLVGCGPCGQRKDKLNRFLPNILKPFTR